MLQDKIPAPNGKKSRLKRQDLEYAKNYVMTHASVSYIYWGLVIIGRYYWDDKEEAISG